MLNMNIMISVGLEMSIKELDVDINKAIKSKREKNEFK